MTSKGRIRERQSTEGAQPVREICLSDSVGSSGKLPAGFSLGIISNLRTVSAFSRIACVRYSLNEPYINGMYYK